MATSEQQKKWPVIRCPHCGMEFAPAEIFMPGDLIGEPTTVLRDALGKIIYQEYDEGSEPAQVGHYVCDECGKSFIVEPVIMYKVKKEDEAKDFSELSSSLLD